MNNELDRRLLLGAAGLAGIAALSSSRAKAGPLTPPAGPVASTAKPLAELEPRTAINATNTPGDANSLFKITQPGSYYLAGNITGVSGKHGIEFGVPGGIASVTLDLNGFELVGVAGSLDGINCPPNTAGIVIRGGGGTVRNWGGDGLNLSNVSGIARLEALRSASNAGNGFTLGSRLLITGCGAYGNSGRGFSGAADSALCGCTAVSNTSDGFNLGIGVTVEGCTSTNNVGDGFVATAATFRGCGARGNDGAGFFIFNESIITACAATGNTASGIKLSGAGGIIDCVATGNGAEGILAASDAIIRGNTCSGNGSAGTGAGIKVTGSSNRIEGNSSTNNDFGIQTGAGGNIITGNTCSGNTTNWVITTNNYYGAIIDRTGVVTGAVAGDSAASTLGTTDQHANFTC
jgi:hypothetical protein